MAHKTQLVRDCRVTSPSGQGRGFESGGRRSVFQVHRQTTRSLCLLLSSAGRLEWIHGDRCWKCDLQNVWVHISSTVFTKGRSWWTTSFQEKRFLQRYCCEIPIISPLLPRKLIPQISGRKYASDNKPSRIYAHGLF